MSSVEEISVELMTAWRLHSFNGLESVKLVENLPLPRITKPTDVLIQVKAASLNVLDVLMTGIKRYKDCLLFIWTHISKQLVYAVLFFQMVMEG